MEYKLKGTIELVKDIRVVSDSFKLREFAINDNADKYPQIINFQLSQDKVDLLDNLKVGDNVEVLSFNLRGKDEWTNPQGEVKVFNTLDAWKVNSETPEQIKQTAEVERRPHLFSR